MKTSYLITGATGYVGSMFVKDLFSKDVDITAIVRNESKADKMLGDKVHLIVGDITDKEFMGSIKGNYDYIVHF